LDSYNLNYNYYYWIINLIHTMRKFYTFLAGMGACISVQAQTSFTRNAVYLEAGGNGLFGSINYEHQFSEKPGFGLRAGLGFYAEYGFHPSIPVAVNYLIPLRNEQQFLEAGLGLTPTLEFNKKSKDVIDVNIVSYVIPSFGFRKHTRNNYMWRINLSPVFNADPFLPWVGFSYGKRF